MSPSSPRSGFTLIELSIVIAIIGLLIGGVIAGRSLIRASELRSVVQQYQSFSRAALTFKEQYGAVPGDLRNATTYWGAAANCPGTYGQGTTTTATCNGNGDHEISPSTNSNEIFHFWKQLANAGLIEGSYNGVTSSSTYYANSDRANSPLGKIKNSVWFAYTPPNNSTGTHNGRLIYSPSIGRIFIFGGMVANSWNYSPVMTPSEAYELDKKIDDGYPLRGQVMAGTSTNCTGTTYGNDTSAAYVLSQPAVSCFLYFPEAF